MAAWLGRAQSTQESAQAGLSRSLPESLPRQCQCTMRQVASCLSQSPAGAPRLRQLAALTLLPHTTC